MGKGGTAPSTRLETEAQTFAHQNQGTSGPAVHTSGIRTHVRSGQTLRSASDLLQIGYQHGYYRPFAMEPRIDSKVPDRDQSVSDPRCQSLDAVHNPTERLSKYSRSTELPPNSHAGI